MQQVVLYSEFYSLLIRSFASLAGREIDGLSVPMLSWILREMLGTMSICWKRFGASIELSSSSKESTARIDCEERAEGGVPATRCCLRLAY